MNFEGEPVEVPYDYVLRETPKARQVMTAEDEVWLPRSCCEFNDERGVALVPEWLAIEKGLV